MSKLGKIGITVGNKTGGSPAATVSQLKSYLKDLQDGFDELKRAAEPAANQVSRLSDSMQHINEATENIVKFSEDLSKKLKDIRAQGVGKLNPDATVFSSFSDLVDIVTNSVDETKLAKFQSVSKSLRAFSSSLTDIVKFSKDANGDVFKQFVSNLNSEDTKNTKNKIFEFINNFMPSDSGMLDTLTTNIEKMNNVVSSVKKYISTLSGLRSTGTKDVDVPEEWNIARQRFYDFIRGFKLEGDVPTYIKNITDLTKPIAKYLSELKTLNRLGEEGKIDTVKWDKTRQAFYDFLRGFGLGGDVPDAIERVDTLTKAVGKYLSEIKVLNKLGQEGGIDTVKWDNVRQKFYDFIRGFGLEGDIPASIERLGTLTKAVGRYLSEIKTLTKTGNIDDSVIEKWNNTRLAFYDFLRGFGTEGDVPESLKQIGILTKALGNYLTLLKGMNKYKATPDNWGDARNSFTSFVTDFNNIASSIKHDKLDELLKVVRKYITIMKTLDSYTPNPSSWNIIRDTFTDFITDFNGTSTNVSYDKTDVLIKSVRKYISIMKTLDSYTPNPSSWDIIRDTFTDFITDFNNVSANISHDKTDELIKYVRKYISIMKTLDSYTPNPSGWNIIRDTFMDFITDFDSLAKDINHAKVDDLVKVVRKYISIMKTLDSYTPNPSAWEIVRDTFTDFITDFDNISSKTSHTNTDELVKSVRKYISIMKTLDSYTPNPSVWDIIRDTFTDFITDFDNISSKTSHTNTDELIKSVRRYVSIMKTLDGYTPDLSAWYIVRDEFTNFISGFVPSDPTISAQLTTGLSMIDRISSVLKKYISMSKAIISFGTVDWASLGNGFKDFISLVASVVSDPRITGISDKSIQHFSKISNSLKGIATLINSVSGKSFSNLRNNLSNAVTEIEAFIDKMASLTSRASFPDFERVANAVGKFNVKLKDVTSTVEHTTRSMTKFHSILRQIYTAFVGGAVIYSIVRSIKSAVKEVFNLEYAMARVNTIARVSSNELKNMTHFVQDVSASYGIASEKVSKALYDINSATIKGVSSLKILEQSAKLAVAGFTDIDKVTNLIARAVNAYEYSVSEAAKISDILFVTVERGINPMEELSEYMGRLFTVSANAGVSLEEVGAGLATLTARGYQTNVASTALNSAILKLSTGTKELNKLFQQYGYASSASALRTMGLTGALQVLYKATNGATEKLHDLGFNYRDIRAATTLASGAISEYNKTLALMNDETYKAGLTNKAYSEVQDTLIFKINRLKETYIVLIQTISEYLNRNQTLKQLLDALTKGVEDFKNSVSGMNLSISDQIGAGLTTLLPKLLGIYGIFKLLSPLLKSVGTFMKSGAPLLPAIGKALGPLYVYLTGIYTVFKGLSRLGSIRELSLGDWARAYLNDFSNGIASGIIDGIRKGFATGLGAIFDILDTALWGTTDFGERIQRWISPTNYKPKEGESTATGWGQAFTNMRAETLRLNADLKNYKENLAELGYSEEAITAKFNELYTSLQNYAEEQGISEKDFKMFSKVLSTTKEELIKFNNQIRISRPNLVATQEVFEASSKSISDNFEKITKPMQKAAFEMIGVENALRVVSGGTGMSSVQLRSAFSSPENYAKFINMLGKSFETSPEVRQAIMLLSETFIKTSNDADKFRKSIVSLGTDLQKIVSRNVSIQDIIGNKFNLSSVSDLKDKLFTVLYDPETIKGLNVSALDKYAIPMAEAIKDKLSLDTILDNMVSLLESDPAMEGLTKEQLRNKASSFYDLLRGIVDFTKEFVNALTELDYIKFMNKLEFGGEISAWSQYKKVDSKLIAELMQREIVRGLNFEEAFREFKSNVSSYGYEGAMAMFNKEHQGSFEIFAEYFKEYEKLFGGSSSNLQTEYKNIKKKVEDFFKNYEDTLLTPIQKFKKTNSLLNEQLNILRQQEREGVLDPELMTHIIENAEKLQKLNEEVMTLKVPASITATDAVRTGSKEAFDLIATNIFRDMYKVNVQQKNYQKEIMNIVKDIGNKAGTSTVNIVSYPM